MQKLTDCISRLWSGYHVVSHTESFGVGFYTPGLREFQQISLKILLILSANCLMKPRCSYNYSKILFKPSTGFPAEALLYRSQRNLDALHSSQEPCTRFCSNAIFYVRLTNISEVSCWLLVDEVQKERWFDVSLPFISTYLTDLVA